MSIDRTAYNALVDDDGSNTVGSLWNKNAIKTVLLDPIDVALVQAGTVVQRLPTTGTVLDLALATPGADTLIITSGGAPLTIAGIVGSIDGQCVTICAGSNAVTLLDMSAACAPQNRLYNLAHSGPTILQAGTGVNGGTGGGVATYRYDSNGAWRLLHHEQGPGIDVPYVGGNFFGNPGSWTVPVGSVLANRYAVRGRRLQWTVFLSTTTIGGTPGQLGLVLPGGFTAAAVWNGTSRVGQIADAGGAVEAIVGPSTANANYVLIYKNNNASWTNGTSSTCLFTIELEVN